MKTKKAAMEMSVGTIVTIVLLMSVLVLGIVLVQKIFFGAGDAIDAVNSNVQDQINKLFSEEGTRLSVYPASREIVIKKGDTPKGFAFSVRNKDIESADFDYEILATDVSQCGSTLNEAKADSYLLGGAGSFSLGPGDYLDLARLVKFSIPETAPPCTIIYTLDVEKGKEPYSSADVFVTIK